MVSRLTRVNQTWAIAYDSAFADPMFPKVSELNDRRFVHLISCALTEDGTELVLADSELSNVMTFCSRGNESTPTNGNVTASLQWLKDANTGGAGSTVDLTSLYNKVTALLDNVDIPYWIISRTGPNASQDIPFAVGQKIKLARFTTDEPQLVMENNGPVRGLQNPLFTGQYKFNYTLEA